jgi:hypothetical protein
MFFRLEDTDNTKVAQYNVFERRLADKLSYLDWKLTYVLDENDFVFLHSKDQTKISTWAINEWDREKNR